MSQQTVCDGCQQAIDKSQPYVTATVTGVQEIDGTLTVVAEAVNRDYHPEHFPSGDTLPAPEIQTSQPTAT